MDHQPTTSCGWLVSLGCLTATLSLGDPWAYMGETLPYDVLAAGKPCARGTNYRSGRR